MFEKLTNGMCALVCSLCLVHGQVSMRAFSETTSLPAGSADFASGASGAPASNAIWSGPPELMPDYGYPINPTDLSSSSNIGFMSNLGYPLISDNSMIDFMGRNRQGSMLSYGYPSGPADPSTALTGVLGRGNMASNGFPARADSLLNSLNRRARLGGIPNLGYPISSTSLMTGLTGAGGPRIMPTFGFPTRPANPMPYGSGVGVLGVMPIYGQFPLIPGSPSTVNTGANDVFGDVLHLGLMGVGGDNLTRFSMLSMCQDPRYTQMCMYMYLNGGIN